MLTNENASLWVTSQKTGQSKNTMCMGCQGGSLQNDRFLVGTIGLNEGNEIQIIEYDSNANSLYVSQVFDHESEVWDITPCPTNPSLCFTSSNENRNGIMNANLYKLEGQNDLPKVDLELDFNSDDDDINNINNNKERKNSLDNIHDDDENVGTGHLRLSRGVTDSNKLPLLKIGSLNKNSDKQSWKKIIWGDSGKNPAFDNHILAIDGKSIYTFDLTNVVKDNNNNNSVDNFSILSSYDISETDSVKTASWNYLTPNIFVANNDNNFIGFDIRENHKIFEKLDAHRGSIKSIDWNPNEVNIFLSSGEDRLLKFWDIRNLDRPIKTFSSHSHWISCAKFNPFHDQLISTGGTDGNVVLWRVSSISSTPVYDLEDDDYDDNSNDLNDGLIKLYDDHEESVYSLNWSPVDAWLFTTLSYDGLLVVHHVPPSERYKILL